MPLCFIEPRDAIRVIAESVGREARRQLLGELVRAWADEIPEPDLESHYAKAVADLLQEVRVAQTGTQILFAFLLGVPFTQRFGEIASFQRTVYYATLLAAA